MVLTPLVLEQYGRIMEIEKAMLHNYVSKREIRIFSELKSHKDATRSTINIGTEVSGPMPFGPKTLGS